MKKTLLVFLILSFSLTVFCGCREQYLYEEEFMDYPEYIKNDNVEYKSPSIVAYGGTLDSDCFLLVWDAYRGVCKGQLFNTDLEPITKEYKEHRGCFYADGHTYFIFTDADENGKFSVICDENGKNILPEGKRYDVIYTDSWHWSNPNGAYIKEKGSRYYYYYDCENLEITDYVYHKERMKWENNNGIENIYDAITGKYLFESRYSEVKYQYLYKKYWFSAKDAEGYHLFLADDSEGELKIREYTEKTFDKIEFLDEHVNILYSGIVRKYFIHCISDEGDLYLDEKGNEITAEFFEYALSGIEEDVLIDYPQILPKGMEIRYEDGYVEDKTSVADRYGRKKAVFSQGKQITDYTESSTEFCDGYYIEWIGYRDGNVCCVIYDVEGNEIYSGHGINAIINNEAFCFTVFAHEKLAIHKIKFLNPAPKIYINGEFMLTDTLPRIKNGRTLVPLRAFAEMMEFQVKEPDEKGRIEISKEGKTVAFTLGSLEGEKDGEKFKLEAAPEIINNRTLVPLRALAEAFECEVEWNGETTEVVIKN